MEPEHVNVVLKVAIKIQAPDLDIPLSRNPIRHVDSSFEERKCKSPG